jgi:DNA-binding transcriptional MerR regulator
MNTVAAEHFLKIGEVASSSGLSVKTIRYYEELGLLAPAVERSHSGYRLFNPQTLVRLAFIKRAQALGLSLNEIKDILGVHDSGQLPCGEMKQHLQEKVRAISDQITTLENRRRELQTLLSDWQEAPPSHLVQQTICPNIQTIGCPH